MSKRAGTGLALLAVAGIAATAFVLLRRAKNGATPPVDHWIRKCRQAATALDEMTRDLLKSA